MKPDSTRHDLVLIGHFAIDTIILRDYNSTSYSLGGGVTYGSLAASSYDPKGRYAIVSKVGKDFNRSFLDIFKTHPIDLSGIKFTEGVSTRFTLDYHDGTRDLRSGGRAEKFGIEDLSESLFNANAIHFTPIADEYTDDFICGLLEHAQTQDTVFGLDVQGLIRGFNADGTIYMKKDSETQNRILKIMRKFGERLFFKGSEQENCAVAGIDDCIEATEFLAKSGCHILTTMGPDGLYYKFQENELKYVPAYRPAKVVDETGAGDCFMAILMIQLGEKISKGIKIGTIEHELKVASAASSFLVEEKGPNGFQSKESILKRVAEKNIIPSQRPAHCPAPKN
jgi:sugar/nucleoside kinase (ribokinase family)